LPERQRHDGDQHLQGKQRQAGHGQDRKSNVRNSDSREKSAPLSPFGGGGLG
jgi:hypothetical protein